jgi:hypothetical protein
MKKKLKKAQTGTSIPASKPLSKSDSTQVANIKKALSDTTKYNGKTFYPSMPSGALDSLISIYKRDNPGKPINKKNGGAVESKKMAIKKTIIKKK